MSEYLDGAAWATGPDQVYTRLAAAAVALLPDPLDGRLALDVGAGTGAASRALRGRGARVVAIDRSESMLRAGLAPAVIADAARLPLRSGVADVAVAAFLLSHVAQPGAVLAELVRVTRSAGAVLVTAFPAGSEHPVKRAVDAALADDGYRPPDWYTDMKRVGEGQVGTAAALARLAAEAGLAAAEVDARAVDIGHLGVAALAAWRLGMAHVVPYLATLEPTQLRRLHVRVHATVTAAALDEPLPMLVLRGRVPG